MGECQRGGPEVTSWLTQRDEESDNRGEGSKGSRARGCRVGPRLGPPELHLGPLSPLLCFHVVLLLQRFGAASDSPLITAPFFLQGEAGAPRLPRTPR